MSNQLPCPFCGSNDISPGEVGTLIAGKKNVSQSECQDCGALGPWADLGKDDYDPGNVNAIAAWNRRPASTNNGS